MTLHTTFTVFNKVNTKYPILNTKYTKYSDTEETHKENDVLDESSDEPFEFPPMTENAKEDYSTHESLLDPETGLATVSSEELLNRKWKFLQEDEQIVRLGQG